jgi:site-specific DNA recombinase
MRIAFYARVSTQRQAQAQTVEQQLERLKRYAEEQSWAVPVEHIFRDDGYSGASLKRPGLDRLRDRAAARNLDLVLITAPDRLARNYVHQVLLLEELEQHGCRVQFPAGVRIEESEAAIVREMFAWYGEDAHSFCSLARVLEQRGILTSTGLARWNLASIRCLLTNPAYVGLVYGNRWYRRGSRERRSATAPSTHSTFSRVDAPQEEWILVTHIPALVSQEQFDRVQAKLASNRRFAHRNNKVHPYLLRTLVSCGVCGLACLARTTIHGYRYYSCTGKLPAVFSHRDQKCASRLSPAGRLEDLVWADLCELLTHPQQVTQALERVHGGNWLPQELQARQEGLRRAEVSLTQQLDRLTEAYLAGVVLLDEYRRRRADLENRRQTLHHQWQLLDAQADRRKELAGLSRSIGDFCARVRQGLEQATFDQKRLLIELLVDRVIVTDGEVEIRYVVPTTRASEQIRFCHLRLAYRGRSRGHQTPHPLHARLPISQDRLRHLEGY